MLEDIVKRIEERLSVVGLSASAASRKAGLSRDAIRNIQRAAKDGTRQGVSTKTIAALAPVLETSQSWLMDGTQPTQYDAAKVALERIRKISPDQAEIVEENMLRLAETTLRHLQR